MRRGYIKEWRDFDESRAWNDPDPRVWKLWSYIKGRAGHRANRVRGNRLHPGELLTGYGSLASGCSPDGVDEKQIPARHRFTSGFVRWTLDHKFIPWGYVARRPADSGSGQIIRILRWSERQADNNPTTTQQQGNDNPTTTLQQPNNNKQESLIPNPESLQREKDARARKTGEGGEPAEVNQGGASGDATRPSTRERGKSTRAGREDGREISRSSSSLPDRLQPRGAEAPSRDRANDFLLCPCGRPVKWSERQGGYYFCSRPSGCGETYYLREIRRRWRIQGGVLAGPSYREGRIVALSGSAREPLRGGQPPPEETQKLFQLMRQIGKSEEVF